MRFVRMWGASSFTDEPVDDAPLAQCLQAAARALEVIEQAYEMSRPDPKDDSRRARDNRATYELHDRAAGFTFTQKRLRMASDLLLVFRRIAVRRGGAASGV